MKKNNEQQTLTKGEMEIMNRLWAIGKEATIKEILEKCDEPKPAYTTVATFLKILTAKGFITQEKHADTGKVYHYKPLLTRDEYTARVMNDVKDSFFGGSVSSLVNFFFRKEEITADEVEHLLEMINQK